MAAALPPSLFSSGDADDAAYRNLRDEVTEPARIGRKFAEELWKVDPFVKTIFRSQ